jgi:hypothetical protein
MAKLTSLLEGPRRDALIADVVAAVEAYARRRKGLRGVTLRAGLAKHPAGGRSRSCAAERGCRGSLRIG